MKKLLALLSTGLLLTACSGGPQTEQYGSATLTYDSGVWETFSNDAGSGLGVRGDASCWIDLSGDLTTPLASEGLDVGTQDAVTFYSDPTSGQPQYVSFDVGSETVYARVSVETPETCVGEILNLVNSTLGE